MSLEFYTVVHFVGISLLIVSLGGMIEFSISKNSLINSSKKHLMLMHGISLLLIAVSGFGLIAKLNLNFSIWLILKILIWVAFGLITSVIFKLNQKLFLYLLIPTLVGLAAYFASRLQNFVL